MELSSTGMRNRSMRIAVLCLVGLLWVLPVYGTSNVSAPVEENIRQSGYIRIGGIDQWIEIRGDKSSNPVLLVLHGGPGSTWDPLVKLFQSWEAHFTVVYWDQRGAGRTFARNGPDTANITIDRVASDGIEVAEYLKQRLSGRTLILLGHSWGSVVGIRIIESRPDLFDAYIGTGQVVNTQVAETLGYREVLRRARLAQRQDAVKALTAMGAPPYNDVSKLGIERRWESEFAAQSEQKFNSMDYVRGLYPPDFTEKDMAQRTEGWLASNYAVYGHKMDGQMVSLNFLSENAKFHIPVLFIQGDDDDVTPTSLVRTYLRQIRAPGKSLVVLHNAGHLAVMAYPDDFLKEMLRFLSRQVHKSDQS